MTRITTTLELQDPVAEADRIAQAIRDQVGTILDRRGVVVAMSGGIDSSVCAALAVHALGPRRVFGLFLPERDSDPESRTLAESWAQRLGIDYTTEDIAPILEAAGCYRRRDAAIRRVVPEYGEGWRSKIVLPRERLDSDRLNVSQLTVQSPDGELRTVRLPPREYREIVAATNFKQRTRKMMEYYHADRLHYAVLGTPNRLEFDQGFFVKGGDGLADLKPIAHLYKTQVYQLAAHFGVPQEVIDRTPTTDTYSLAQTQEEFYFLLPTRPMDRALHAYNNDVPAADAGALLGFDTERVERVYREIRQKRTTTRYLHLGALMVDPVPEIELQIDLDEE